MKMLSLWGLLSCGLLVSSGASHAEDEPTFEKLRDTSPDKKFALRVSCSEQPADPENIDSAIITAIDLVSLPSKAVVASLAKGIGGGFSLVWSPDSKWCAFSSSAGPRVTETSVFRLKGDEFVPLHTDNLQVPVNGDVRNEYINAKRWIKPGTLLLEQFDILRGGAGDATYQFTVRFDDAGNFHIVSKKKVPSKTEEEN